MSEPVCTGTEIIRTTIAVDMVRQYFIDGTDTWTEIGFTKIHAVGTDLTADERSYFVEQVYESTERETVINALLDAAAGRTTNLI